MNDGDTGIVFNGVFTRAVVGTFPPYEGVVVARSWGTRNLNGLIVKKHTFEDPSGFSATCLEVCTYENGSLEPTGVYYCPMGKVLIELRDFHSDQD